MAVLALAPGAPWVAPALQISNAMATQKPNVKPAPKTSIPDTKESEKEQPNPGDPGAPILEPRTPQGLPPEVSPLSEDPPIGY